ncbi:hypothetical protein HPP92_020643 [Vanilla planifolia]|uniref:Uncharacterized protein n=1 Tax=Vanilla planifolia TaxID=51239 RepID=A0A835Q369_VANPL|nr:hypothetical protein HPP92_021005 [Vanilla planifolia]KAG0462167.1 hypothetical protein HPP92_020643 [Vanilla planifolia]
MARPTANNALRVVAAPAHPDQQPPIVHCFMTSAPSVTKYFRPALACLDSAT